MTVVVSLEGGLGSQMFGYAYGRALSLSKGTGLVVDPTHLGSHRTARTYKLDVFNIHAELFKSWQDIEDPFAVSGNYLGERYFKEYESVIRQDYTFIPMIEFTLQHKRGYDFFEQASGSNSVSLSVRRGDYVTDASSNSFHGTCSLEYYQKSMEYVASRVTDPLFFLFSDDIIWVKKNLQVPYPHVFVSGNDLMDYEEMMLISKCKHHIIANSTFGWWGAWLNPSKDKIVCSPRQWTRRSSGGLEDVLLPKEWILL